MTAAPVLASVLSMTGQPSANLLISAAQAAASTLLAWTVAELARRGWRCPAQARRRPAPRRGRTVMTPPPPGGVGSPPMRPREFADLADEVAAACQRHGVRAWSEDDRVWLAAALWRFIHPDLAGTRADPYTDPDDD